MAEVTSVVKADNLDEVTQIIFDSVMIQQNRHLKNKVAVSVRVQRAECKAT
jgi:hypothetical protein